MKNTKDITEKTLESFDDVFADIVNGLLFGGEPVIPEHSLQAAVPRSVLKTDGRLHEQERDTAKYWNSTEHGPVSIRLALFGIENQTSYDRDMPLRILGYDGAEYRAELTRKERYPAYGRDPEADGCIDPG